MSNHPHAALLTPVGRGAVATVAVWGVGAVEAVSRWFRPVSSKPLAERASEAIMLGHWRHADASNGGEELVVCKRAADKIEVHCHGGRAAAEAIVASLESAGCAVARWEDWVDEQEPDPFARAARTALSQARTERTAAVLLDQYRGALVGAWAHAIAHLEENDAAGASRILLELKAAGRIGVRLMAGWRIVIAGRPNVGKSTLLNALVGYERAIVHPTAGTTRNIVTASAAFDGWPVELADTAGLRSSEEAVEAAGIARARRLVGAADCVVVVRDAAADVVEGEDDAILRAGRRLVVYNKCDLLTPAEKERIENRRDGRLVSAKTGEGIAALVAAIGEQIAPHPPAAGDAVPFLPNHVAAIERALQAIEGGDAQTSASILRGELFSTKSPLEIPGRPV